MADKATPIIAPVAFPGAFTAISPAGTAGGVR
jgi:hypothetical protein